MALLAALLGMLPRGTLRRLHLVMSPDTVLRWHHDLLNRRHAARSRPKHPGRPRTVATIRRLVMRLARENGTWGYRRIHGELALLGVTVAASTGWEILKEAGVRRRDRLGGILHEYEHESSLTCMDEIHYRQAQTHSRRRGDHDRSHQSQLGRALARY